MVDELAEEDEVGVDVRVVALAAAVEPAEGGGQRVGDGARVRQRRVVVGRAAEAGKAV